jgi:cytochrome c
VTGFTFAAAAPAYYSIRTKISRATLTGAASPPAGGKIDMNMKMKSGLAALVAAAALIESPAAFAQQATLEQAKDLVKKGRAFLREQGCKKTFQEVTNGKMFTDAAHKELYLYMYDDKLTNLAHGGNSKLPGKNLSEMKDTKGRLLNQELLKAAKKGGGAVEFDFLNPGTGMVDPKVGWAEMEEKTDCGPVMVGSGIYRPKK